MENEFKNLIAKMVAEEIEEEIDEVTDSTATPGYNTPMAFSKKEKKNKKIKALMKGKSLEGSKIVKEDIKQSDIETIKKIIRSEVADIIRDIWLKRTSWKGR